MNAKQRYLKLMEDFPSYKNSLQRYLDYVEGDVKTAAICMRVKFVREHMEDKAYRDLDGNKAQDSYASIEENETQTHLDMELRKLLYEEYDYEGLPETADKYGYYWPIL